MICTREVETVGAPMLENELNREPFEEPFKVLSRILPCESVLIPGKLWHQRSSIDLGKRARSA